MKTISVLIPSRGNPIKCSKTIDALLCNAFAPSAIEVILRLDLDDPKVSEYPQLFNRTIVGHRMSGYRDLNKMYEECAELSTGEVLLVYNDDLEVQTHGWDSMYQAYCSLHPLKPLCSHVTGDHYQWAFPAISRELYEKAGSICPGDSFVVDRVWHAYARAKGWTDAECNSGVHLHHHRIPPEEGAEDRKLFMRGVEKDLTQHQEHWDLIGRELAARI